MNLKKRNEKGSAILLFGIGIGIVLIIILVIIAVLIFYQGKDNDNINVNLINEETSNKLNTNSNEIDIEKNEDSNNTVISNGDSENDVLSLIKLDVKGKKTLESGDELIYINDYKIIVPLELIQIGYEVTREKEGIRIKAKDDSYQCILLQLSDNYVMPTEKEIEGFTETEEYKSWDEEEYDSSNESIDLRWEKYDKISSAYYKRLGYTAQNSPNYTLTQEELKKVIGEYILEGERGSGGSNNLFPGYQYYDNYDWGRVVLYTIPKYYNDSTFGERTSDISVCIYLFEYYDSSKVKFNVRFTEN